MVEAAVRLANVKPDRGAFAGCAVNVDVPLHRFDQLLGDGESQSGAAERSGQRAGIPTPLSEI
jgi:hypothetical protein